MSRVAGAEIIREVADGVENGTIDIEGENGFAVAVPEHFELEVEYEVTDDEAEFEVELDGRWKTANRYQRTNNTVTGLYCSHSWENRIRSLIGRWSVLRT